MIVFSAQQAMVVYDVDGAAESILSVTLECGEGEFVMGDGSGLVFDDTTMDLDGGNDLNSSAPLPSGILRFNGTAADINRAMRDLRYRGLPGRVGQDVIQITVTDDPGPCPGDFNVSASSFNATTSVGFNGTAGGGDAPCVLGGPKTTQSEMYIFLSAVNKPPSVNVPEAGTYPLTTVDAAQAAHIGSGGAISVEDPDVRETAYYSAGGLRIEGPISVAVVCTNGSLSLGARAGLSFIEGDGVSDPVLRFTGAIDDANRALASLNYRCSSLDECGEGVHDITVSVDDNGFTGSGGALSANATFSVQVDSAVVV